MAEKENNFPQSYPIVYVVSLIAIICYLLFFGPSSTRPKITRVKNGIVSKKKPTSKKIITAKSQVNKKDTVSIKKEDTVTTIVNLMDEDPTPKPPTNNEFFRKLKSNYQENIYSKLDRPKNRTDLIIRYYKKDNDDNKIYGLRKLGFYIHERPSDSALSDYNSNALYYGDSVNIEDIQIIAYTLINSGLDLKMISPSRYHDTWKAHSLEIGTDTSFLKKKNLKLSDIRNAFNE